MSRPGPLWSGHRVQVHVCTCLCSGAPVCVCGVGLLREDPGAVVVEYTPDEDMYIFERRRHMFMFSFELCVSNGQVRFTTEQHSGTHLPSCRRHVSASLLVATVVGRAPLPRGVTYGRHYGHLSSKDPLEGDAQI